MAKILALLIKLFFVYLFGSGLIDSIEVHYDAGKPLVASAKSEPSMWKLVRDKEGTSHWRYRLENGKQSLQICEDTNGYIECSRFMSQRVQSVCPAQSGAQGALDAKAGGTPLCYQLLGHRLEAEPLVVSYAGKELVSVAKPNGEPVLKPSEWAEARKGYLQREAKWGIGFNAILLVLVLGM